MALLGGYILRGKEPVQVDWLQGAKWCQNNLRRIRKTRISKEVEVITSFLPIDHQFEDGKPPILFETMVFGGKFDGAMWRYYTYDESVRGHRSLSKMLFIRIKLLTCRGECRSGSGV